MFFFATKKPIIRTFFFGFFLPKRNVLQDIKFVSVTFVFNLIWAKKTDKWSRNWSMMDKLDLGTIQSIDFWTNIKKSLSILKFNRQNYIWRQ